MPFHAFITSWAANNFGYLDLFRLWKEALLMVLGGLMLIYLAKNPKALNQAFKDKLVLLILAFTGLLVLMTAFGIMSGKVSLEAAAFGLILDTRGLMFFLMVYLYLSSSAVFMNWKKLILLPALVVVGFGLLQFVLPADFLTHFGYGPGTMPAYQLVDNKPDFVRLQSTMRGPNPLGVYLVLIISVVVSLFFAARQKRLRLVAFGVASGLVLIGTYSRSAWIGATLAVLFICYQALTNPKFKSAVLLSGLVVVCLLTVTVVMLRDNDLVQNVFFHTDENSQATQSSNESRAYYLQSAVVDLVKHPLGAGVGSAGPASYRNDSSPARISENYFLQIGQEAGLLGMFLYIAITLVVVLRLWRQHPDSLALALLGSLLGITAVNMLSHAWTDDTLAYIWWGLAAIALTRTASVTRPASQADK